MSPDSFRDRAKLVTPGGSQTRSKRDLFDSVPFIKSADGAYVYAVGRQYIDWIAGLASVGLGYSHFGVDNAVIRQIRTHGNMFPLPTELEVEVAELLISVLKWPEQVRWVKTGSEATAAAMQIARAYTRRKKVVSIGYHGWHEAHQPSDTLIDVPWGSWKVLEGPIDCQTAAVLLEPARDQIPPPCYLQDIQNQCRAVGALLIMDEVVTGFRWAIGGFSENAGITPDLACFGKAMANGYPLAAIVGPRRVMEHAHAVSSTFGGECVGLAAAKATIEIYRDHPVIETLWARGQQLMDGVPELEGYPVHPHFPGEGKWTSERSRRSQRAAEMGVLSHPAGMNPMFSHTPDDVKKTIDVLNAVAEADK